jgi:signal transduction histidine kinase
VSTPRLTIRVRLSLLYTGLFVTCGAIVIAISYALVAGLPPVPGPAEDDPARSTADTTQELEHLRAYAVCMRANGIAMSDPDPTGNMRIGDRPENVTKAQLDTDPGYRAASAACDDKLPESEKRARQCQGSPWDQEAASRCKAALRDADAAGAQRQRDATLAHLLRYSSITLAAATLLAALAGWIVAGRVLRPVHQITEAARTASEHNLGARVSLTGPRDELRELADTFDTMLSRLQAAFETQGRFIANAGHELRTPLTVMRASVDVVLAKPAPTPGELRRMGRDVRVAVDHAERLIDALLTLARNERGLSVREPVDLSTVAENVVDATDRGDRRLHVSLEPGMTSGDPVLLERLVANLVDNAVRYNVPDGDVWLATSTADGQVAVVVANTGPSLTRSELGMLFEPFQRLRARTTGDGFGLGLAIVASIAAVHRGAVAAEARSGGGLTVTVTMPGRPENHPATDR